MNATPSSISTRLLAAMLFAAVLLSSPGAGAADEGWVSLFDGTTLAGWKASENPASFRVVDGTIACDGPRAHLFYVGLDGKASFENFEAQVEVRARAGANSGFYFHTAYQEKDCRPRDSRSRSTTPRRSTTVTSRTS